MTSSARQPNKESADPAKGTDSREVTALQKKISGLEQIIKNISKENKELRSQPPEIKTVSVKPGDYDIMKQQLQTALNTNKKLMKLVENGSFLELDSEISLYRDISKRELKKIMALTQASDYSDDTMLRVRELIKYLQSAISEFKGIMAINTQGRYVDKEIYRRCYKLKIGIQEIIIDEDFFNNVEHEHVDELTMYMKEFLSHLRNCMKDS